MAFSLRSGAAVSAVGEIGWYSDFNMRGTRGDVLALAHDGRNLYVAGEFSHAGGIPARNIARWDGEQWSALGSGLDDKAEEALAVLNGVVYAGGWFEYAGGKPSGQSLFMPFVLR